MVLSNDATSELEGKEIKLTSSQCFWGQAFEIIPKIKSSWLEHTMRHKILLMRMLGGKIRCERTKGRPRNNYTTEACKDNCVQTYAELKRIAENTQWWRDIIQFPTNLRTEETNDDDECLALCG